MKKNPKLDKESEDKVAKLLGFVDEKSIITIDKIKGIIYIGGQRVDPVRLASLQAESTFLLNSELWKILSETIRHMAHEIMFTKSKTYEDLLSGKMWLYHLDIQKKILETFKSFRKPPTSPAPTQTIGG